MPSRNSTKLSDTSKKILQWNEHLSDMLMNTSHVLDQISEPYRETLKALQSTIESLEKCAECAVKNTAGFSKHFKLAERNFSYAVIMSGEIKDEHEKWLLRGVFPSGAALFLAGRQSAFDTLFSSAPDRDDVNAFTERLLDFYLKVSSQLIFIWEDYSAPNIIQKLAGHKLFPPPIKAA